MSTSWQVKPLGEVAAVTAGNPAPQDKALFKDGTHPFFRTADAGRIRFGEIYESADYLNDAGTRGLRLFPKGTILFPKSGASTFLNHRVMLGVGGFVASHLAAVIADERQINSRFLMYQLSTVAAQDLVQDHKYPSLNLPTIAAIPVSVPSLDEQRRIADVLDEAFDAIASARVNFEKNVQNAQALFKSHIRSVFDTRGEGWFRTTVGEQVTLQRGFDITKSEQRDGPVPVVSSSGIKSFHDKAMTEAPGVVIGRKGTLGKVFYLETDFWPHDTTLWVREFNGNDPRFVYYFFSGLDVQHLDSGAANPALNRNQVHPIEVYWPPVAAQKQLVATFESLSKETRRLAKVYEQKLVALDALKNSLLHQAFTGKLGALST